MSNKTTDIHSLIITTLQGNILFSKFYDPATEIQHMLNWEHSLFSLTLSSWEESKVAQQIAVEGSLFVLYQSVDEIIVFLTGGGEENEITLSMALAEIVSMFQFNFKKGITEALFISNYSQIILWLDEVITNGFINLTDRALVEQFNALTWKDEKKSKK
eukprot:TRINITY_DN4658_c0_g1_i1.p1 TRINITY_DN4658_c0_g1~~TRINITY_DN4658_c0_g1_i1.p1  ORF type:complete len:159 (-),score=34.42 TRINITY_DN4658_c0_g1_i1:131-607(-)